MIQAAFVIADGWEFKVADSTADNLANRAALAKVANRTVNTAVTTLSASTNSGNKSLIAGVIQRVVVKDAGKIFRRRTFPANSRIPVFLVSSNSNYSVDFENGLGSGIRIPATHFMKIAARSQRSQSVVYYPGAGNK